MLDREFVEELIALTLYGATDKKIAIRKLYQEGDQFDAKRLAAIEKDFKSVLKVLVALNKKHSLLDSRYSQKNDFYTLFSFIKQNPTLHLTSFIAFFDLLIKIQDDISPSNDHCEPLQYYAFNCVTQSNSKNARDSRLLFFSNLFLNKSALPNKTQKDLLKYYNIQKEPLVEYDSFFTLNSGKIVTQFIED
jgi:hypothetical protein